MRRVIRRRRRVVRRSIFETASSSVHALVIHKTRDDNVNRVSIGHGEWGWESEVYNDPSGKASYLWEGMVTYEKPDDAHKNVERLENILREAGVSIEYEEDYFKPDEDGYIDRGYVDHAGVLTKIIEDMSDEDILNFILSYDSILVTGNDNNYDDFDELMAEFGYGKIYTPSSDYKIMIKGN